ncbi:MAG TPA: hypothetical protein VMB49_10950 [Acidobacteriaceae bacterium]|nr:hypothetical protein [Acidobacteriaceae bacterium]
MPDTLSQRPLPARIVSASFVLLSGSGLATAINFSYNIAVARFLGPKGFGHATAVYTLLTFLSAVTLSFQIISAKVVAQQDSLEGKRSGYLSFHRGAWMCGICAALLLLLFQRNITAYLHLPGQNLVVLLSVGAAFYVPLGSRRGYLQGAYGFRRLAASLVLEGAVRFGGSLLLILLGLGVEGVIVANSLAIAVAYLAIVPKAGSTAESPLQFPQASREILQAIVFFSGQVLINNADIVLVKHFFLPRAAGLYAAVAMVGRVVFAFSWAVVNGMFPLVAGTRGEERRDLRVVATALLLVLSIGSAIAIVLRLVPAEVWTLCLGDRFDISGKYGLPYLLALYAVTTVIYCLSAVLIAYEMSYKIANTSWVQLIFSAIVIAGICRFHTSLRQVILVQLVLMLALLVCVAIPFLASYLSDAIEVQGTESLGRIRRIRRLSEDEVIARFLRTDFHHPAFAPYQSLDSMVNGPNLKDPAENEKRRALLFIRHSALWNELPPDTEWYELDIKEEDLCRIRVFPRAQWRKIACGDFSIITVGEGIQRRRHAIDRAFLKKIDELRDQLQRDDVELGPVLLIGMGETEPLTILDGNHRLVAAMVTKPNRMHRLHFIAGLSPSMNECCWYNTNLTTLFHYGRNVMKEVVRRPKVDLARLLNDS